MITIFWIFADYYFFQNDEIWKKERNMKYEIDEICDMNEIWYMKYDEIWNMKYEYRHMNRNIDEIWKKEIQNMKDT